MSDLVQRMSNLSPEKRAILQRKLLEKRATPAAALPVITRRTTSGPCAVSFGQELMWLLDQLTPGISAYNVPRVLRLQGRLDREALKKSLAGILQRHSILRTTYSVSDGIPLQVVDEQAQVHLREIDLSSLSNEQREAEALRIVIEESDKSFDLKRDLMMRTTLIRLGQEEHIFVLVTHHIASDGVSRTLLFRELAAHYEAFTKGVEPKLLPELPIQFADFALWQRDQFKAEVLQKQLEYWEKQLAGAPPVLELPTDHPRPAVQTHTGARFLTSYPKATAVKLREFGQKEGATQFMLMLAVFKVLLHRYTGQEEIVVGTPMSGRSWTEIENLIGYFSNSLVLRTSFAGNPSFRQLLQ
ncbi:MAG: condensation domain-containing protein, partial [Verrucomicrobiota bacterium]